MAAMATTWNSNKKPSEPERWICIYPAYIDAGKTKAAGRRIPKSRAVERPTGSEILDVLTAANFKAVVEPKFYSREVSKEPERQGRVKVQLKNDDGTAVNPAYPTRESLFLYCGDKIPTLKSRVFKSGSEAHGAQGGAKKKGKGGRR